ncbi:MAG: hypothetical protein CVU04_02450 [Bacteroidetes bacterium HGW-Bacteroidetes-20]|nr:MAG: hypothetical protein CVU04_02450 [Bacteroidetes bacterium HGW-Bacteroidetes-20]
MKQIFFIIFLSAIIVTFTSCDDTDLTPAYLVITEADFQNCIDMTDFNALHEESYDQFQLEALASQKFKDVWVYVNGKNLGCWELPCKIPILPDYTEENIIKLVPGVRLNGVSTMIPAYPFLSVFSTAIMMDREETYYLSDRNVSFTYPISIKFPLLETFDQSTTFESIDADGINMEITTENQQTIGKISIDDTLDFFDVKSPIIQLKGSGNFTFWEMDYKCDNNIYCELFIHTISGTTIPVSLVSLNPTNGVWKKIYINLTSTLTNYTSASSTIPIELVMTGNKKSDQSNTYFYFDNVKIITFK